ncbi:fructosamine kinase family protein [Arthrobacter sp. UM1]|uniref:fructosamine kinase family protein n=1 Tax=Arthrobacter sp. UM1 TaxID=2766776 RepID=UPI001CF63283|nr:fructosamine kinase family protein [Arthrobacter sp. UM1]MCB4208201.1 fructosamine kinase family protein [Arthrobacter sp. UM1]
MADLAQGIPSALTEGLGVRSARPVAGGDIARSFRLETDSGPLFLKTGDHPPELFLSEARGLEALREHAPAELRVPEVVRGTGEGIVLEWIPEGSHPSEEPRLSARETEEELGRGLAKLHRASNSQFGGIDGARTGYLGAVETDLTPARTWPEFLFERRLRPLTRQAVDSGAMPSEALGLLDAVERRAEEICGPEEKPALVHGDLWVGNRMVDGSGRSWLIDPAAFWGHREADLAMMQLFGGFGDAAFEAYEAENPPADGWRERIRWNQLTPLLVHAILFGGGYGNQALAVLREYA